MSREGIKVTALFYFDQQRQWMCIANGENTAWACCSSNRVHNEAAAQATHHCVFVALICIRTRH